MKYIIAILAVTLFTGCFYQKVDQTDILKAEAFCKEHKGLNYINSHFIGDEWGSCIDGTGVDLGKYKLLPVPPIKD